MIVFPPYFPATETFVVVRSSRAFSFSSLETFAGEKPVLSMFAAVLSLSFSRGWF